MLASGAPIHVATDWPAFGVFFLGLIGTFGGFTAWVLRRLDRNRKDWKEFVTGEIERASTDLRRELAQVAELTSDNSRELREQGKAIARIEGKLSRPPEAAPV